MNNTKAIFKKKYSMSFLHKIGHKEKPLATMGDLFAT
jgi:hypothetical protein